MDTFTKRWVAKVSSKGERAMSDGALRDQEPIEKRLQKVISYPDHPRRVEQWRGCVEVGLETRLCKKGGTYTLSGMRNGTDW